MPALPSTLLNLNQALSKAHPLCSPQLECRLGWKEKAALLYHRRGYKEEGSPVFTGRQRRYCEEGGGGSS